METYINLTGIDIIKVLRPAGRKDMTTTPKIHNFTVKEKIWQIAEQHNITHQHSQLDRLGESISRLSDNEMELDETQWLLVELGRAKVITGQEQIALNTQYMFGTNHDLRSI